MRPVDMNKMNDDVALMRVSAFVTGAFATTTINPIEDRSQGDQNHPKGEGGERVISFASENTFCKKKFSD